MINKEIKKLVTYGVNKSLLEECDVVYTINQIISALGLEGFEDSDISDEEIVLENILKNINDYAVEKGIIEDSITHRDLFDTKIMGLLMPRPSEIIAKFESLYQKSPKEATDYFYKLSKDSDYIRTYRIEKDKKWTVDTPYGNLDITINLSKPEKDPKAIAAAKNAPQSGYPKCLLCRENEGYSGRINSPARQNHRIIPVKIDNADFFLQYSPYVYYNEHCIVFNKEHTPMKIDRSTFAKLLSFVAKFPHYFVGSNADLPIVGGSILSHDHFQGGNYEFPMAKASVDIPVSFDGFKDIEAGIVNWPMSCIRLKSENTTRLIDLASKILDSWRNYTDKESFIFAETNGEPHNTITPIARKRDGLFEIDLVLRNNITTPEHPLGVYHPHSELHNIKKENIGLIEVMGLAVLPARLNTELKTLADFIVAGKDIKSNETISKHADWVESFKANYSDINEGNVMKILCAEVGKVFSKVLEHAGVYKTDDEGRKAFLKFINSVK